MMKDGGLSLYEYVVYLSRISLRIVLWRCSYCCLLMPPFSKRRCHFSSWSMQLPRYSMRLPGDGQCIADASSGEFSEVGLALSNEAGFFDPLK